eukprot:12100657-Ditylum_brightwellii.AAC.1
MELGINDGEELCCNDGMELGLEDDEELGCNDGMKVRVKEGIALGFVDGMELGASDGIEPNSNDGVELAFAYSIFSPNCYWIASIVCIIHKNSNNTSEKYDHTNKHNEPVATLFLRFLS